MSLFITIEGVEGAGKSTLQSKLAPWIRALGQHVVLTKEPGATAIGQELRELVLHPKHANLHPLVELLLFAADRAQHVTEVIRPALDQGIIVICDRYIHSTLAYQGHGRGLKQEDITFLNNLTTEGLKPDLVLLLDVNPQLGLARAKSRSIPFAERDDETSSASLEWNRFEQQSLAFHQRVRDGFLELAKLSENNFVIINAEQHTDRVVEEATAAAKSLFKKKGMV